MYSGRSLLSGAVWPLGNTAGPRMGCGGGGGGATGRGGETKVWVAAAVVGVGGGAGTGIYLCNNERGN